jgi:hypothetical protein
MAFEPPRFLQLPLTMGRRVEVGTSPVASDFRQAISPRCGVTEAIGF